VRRRRERVDHFLDRRLLDRLRSGAAAPTPPTPPLTQAPG
jgi:hypothetical protein